MTPGGSEIGVMANVAGLIVSVMIWASDPNAASCKTNVWVVVPTVLLPGVPVIVPELASSESPAGRGGVTSQLYGAVPPAPVSVASKSVPTVAGGSVVVVIVNTTGSVTGAGAFETSPHDTAPIARGSNRTSVQRFARALCVLRVNANIRTTISSRSWQ